MTYEEKILASLTKNYRKSKKDMGESKINRRTRIKPDRLYRKYSANDGDFEEIIKLDQAVEALEKKGFVIGEREAFGTQLKHINLVDEKIEAIEDYMAKQWGYVSKDARLKILSHLIGEYKNASPVCAVECARLEKYVESRKLPQNLDKLEDILKALAFIENNKEDLYVREVSVKVYGDSKYFEKETLHPVCRLLWQYAKRKPDDEMADEILEDYHIWREPKKLCLKGRAVIYIDGKSADISGFPGGVEFLAADLDRISRINILAPKFMTIENRTSYLRYYDDQTVTFYLGGYGDRYQRDLLKMIIAANPHVLYEHFGDIDAGGFLIHQHLCEMTGMDFKLFAMSVRELKNPRYARCLHPLTDNDRVRLLNLKNRTPYEDVINYMLDHNIKLEQEIISLDLLRRLP